MNSVLYHLAPGEGEASRGQGQLHRCASAGLSFFLFILLTVTGIFLMFFYRPTAAAAWDDIYTLQTSVTFGLLVRNMHRWGAHLMVLTVFLHMARVFYHGAYKPPREFNWVIGVILLTLTLLLSFTGYLLPWDQLALWAVTVGTNMMGYTPVFGDRCDSCCWAASRSARHVVALVRAARPDASLRDRHLHGDPLLASPQGRRHLGAALGRAGDTMTEVPEHLLKRAQEARDGGCSRRQLTCRAADRLRDGDAEPRRRASEDPGPPPRARKAARIARRGCVPSPRSAAAAAGWQRGCSASAAARRSPTGPGGHTQTLAHRRQVGSIQDVKAQPVDKVHVWPHLLVVEFVAALLITAFTLIFSIFVNAPLLELANFNETPNPSKAPWYFLGLQELLTMFHPMVAGVTIPGMGSSC